MSFESRIVKPVKRRFRRLWSPRRNRRLFAEIDDYSRKCGQGFSTHVATIR